MNFSQTVENVRASAPGVAEVGENAINSLSDWWNNPATQQWLIEIPIRILLVLIVALVLHGIARRLINRMAKSNIDKGLRRNLPTFRRKSSQTELNAREEALRDAQEQRRQSRIRTLASVFNSAAAIVIWVWAVLAILSEIGVNVGPLIASAGIVGVALGFGAQSLVKDFLSGIFMLLEDQYGVGDTIDAGDGIIGDVEDISLRITTLRDIDGTLWYVRNGEILRIGNMSDEYAIARIEVPISLTNDTEKAWDTIWEATKEFAQDPEIADAVLEEPTMNGLTEINPDYATFRLSIKTLPSRQWQVQRLIQSKLINRLREEDISLPYPEGIGISSKLAGENPSSD